MNEAAKAHIRAMIRSAPLSDLEPLLKILNQEIVNSLIEEYKESLK
jgi:hypothetical protein